MGETGREFEAGFVEQILTRDLIPWPRDHDLSLNQKLGAQQTESPTEAPQKQSFKIVKFVTEIIDCANMLKSSLQNNFAVIGPNKMTYLYSIEKHHKMFFSPKGKQVFDLRVFLKHGLSLLELWDHSKLNLLFWDSPIHLYGNLGLFAFETVAYLIVKSFWVLESDCLGWLSHDSIIYYLNNL